jgi:DNA-binding beta-propeller fold protein YncE
MWPPRRWSDRNALSRYWNALVSGVSDDVLAPLAAALDDEQLVAIERLRSRSRYQPDPAFVARLERDLVREVAAVHTTTAPVGHMAPNSADGLFPPYPRGLAGPRAPQPRRWALAPVLTALLVIVTLAVAYTIFINPPGTENRIPVMAPEATPATPSAGATPAAEASPSTIPLWRTIPVPSVGAAFVWKLEGPPSTGTDFSSHITVDPDGHLWVLDGTNNRFQIYDADGHELETWGEAGTGEGQFDFQRDSGEALGGVGFVPFHADEGFYIADSQNARIQQFDAERDFVRAWGSRGTGEGQFLEPVAVLINFGEEDAVYVIDAGRDDVQVFTRDGAYLRTIGRHGAEDGEFDHAGGGTFDPHGYFWIADTGNDRIQEFNTYPPGRGQHKLTVGGPGTGEGELDRPQAVASAADPHVYVADRGNRRVEVFAMDGRFAGVIEGAAAGGTAFTDPVGLVVDWDGALYVLDDDGTQLTIQKFRVVLPE